MYTENDTNPSSSRRWGWFSRDRRTAASWSERAPKEASSALASAPGVAEGEGAGRQRAPEPEKGVNEPRTASAADSAEQLVADSITPLTEPSARQAPAAVEQLSWREPGAPALPARMNRKRTAEKRDQEKKIRFTPTAVRLHRCAEARRRHQKFAGFVGDAALAVALGKAGMVGSPEDDPVRPLVEAVEAHTKALNRDRHQPQPGHDSHPLRRDTRACRGRPRPHRAGCPGQLRTHRPAPGRRSRSWCLTSPPAPAPSA